MEIVRQNVIVCVTAVVLIVGSAIQWNRPAPAPEPESPEHFSGRGIADATLAWQMQHKQEEQQNTGTSTAPSEDVPPATKVEETTSAGTDDGAIHSHESEPLPRTHPEHSDGTVPESDGVSTRLEQLEFELKVALDEENKQINVLLGKISQDIQSAADKGKERMDALEAEIKKQTAPELKHVDPPVPESASSTPPSEEHSNDSTNSGAVVPIPDPIPDPPKVPEVQKKSPKRVMYAYTQNDIRQPASTWDCWQCRGLRNAESQLDDFRIIWRNVYEDPPPAGLIITGYPHLWWNDPNGVGKQYSGWSGVPIFRAMDKGTLKSGKGKPEEIHQPELVPRAGTPPLQWQQLPFSNRRGY